MRPGAWEDHAQSTVEFAVVLVGLLAMILGLGAIWRAGSDGVFLRLVEDAASHGLDAEGAVDIALY